MLVAIITVFACHIGVANAASTADKVLERINKVGYISDPMDGRKMPCPCKLLGSSREGETETIYIATSANMWFEFRCTNIKDSNQSTLCKSAGEIMGQAWIQR
jgi:hypothetical protein